MDIGTGANSYATRMLNRFDKNGSGKIEYRTGSADARLMSRDHQRAFAQMDTNRDGKVGVHELRRHYFSQQQRSAG